jgi:hypothetical protein
MKNTPENIGRKIIYKNIIFSVAIIFLLPLLIVLIKKIGGDNQLDYLTFYENIFKSYTASAIAIILQIIILLGFIYVIAGIIGRKIIKEKINPFKGTFIALNLIWLCFFIVAMINEVILKAIYFEPTLGIISDVIVSWLIYGLILFIIVSLIYSSILSIFITREFKKAIKKDIHVP